MVFGQIKRVPATNTTTRGFFSQLRFAVALYPFLLLFITIIFLKGGALLFSSAQSLIRLAQKKPVFSSEVIYSCANVTSDLLGCKAYQLA